MTSSDGQKRLIYLKPDYILLQFSRPSELLNTSIAGVRGALFLDVPNRPKS